MFKWTEEFAAAFKALRLKLVSPPILSFPDYSREFILDTDASDTGIGCVLSQIHEDGAEHVIAYGSRVLSKPERNYCVTRHELLAVVYFTQHFWPYLLGRHFVLRSDHGSLMWLHNFKEPEGQLARWLQKLEEYSFTVVHRPGLKHCNADALSRLPCVQCGRDEHGKSTKTSVEVNAMQIGIPHITQEELCQYQTDDPVLGPVLEHLHAGRKPEGDDLRAYSPLVRRLLQQWQQLEVKGGVLWRRFVNPDGSHRLQLIIPQALHSEVLQELHAGLSGGHLGEERTFKRLQERFYWPGQRKDVQNWCQTCPTCASRKSPAPKHRGPLRSITAGYPMPWILLDLCQRQRREMFICWS